MKMQKSEIMHVVVDTSALMSYPKILERKSCIFYVPSTVIKQLDGLKNSDNIKTNEASRSASYYIEKAQLNSRVFILNNYDRIEGLDNVSDNKIVGAAVLLARILPDKKIYMLTTDRNMGIIANGYNLELFDFDELDSCGQNSDRKKIPIWLWIAILIAIAMMLTFPFFFHHPVYRWVGASGCILFVVGCIIASSYVLDLDLGVFPVDDSGGDDDVWKGDRINAGGLGMGINKR